MNSDVPGPAAGSSTDTSGYRREYGDRPFDIDDLAPSWWEQFGRWFAEAASLTEPNALVLATAGAESGVRARTVLMKSFDPHGFVFASNYDSRKGVDLAVSPRAALVFPWHEVQRQVHAEGPVERVEAAESDRIWAARPRAAQISALASPQSAVIESRETLTERVREWERTEGELLRPAGWGGYRLRPDAVEFWQGRRDRLHDRLRFRRVGAALDQHGWAVERLAP